MSLFGIVYFALWTAFKTITGGGGITVISVKEKQTFFFTPIKQIIHNIDSKPQWNNQGQEYSFGHT